MIFKNYFKQSKSPFYSFLYILPLFIIYELGIYAISSDDIPIIRNGADVLLRNVLAKVGITGIHGMALIMFIGVVIAYFIKKGKFKSLSLNSNYFLIMIVESLIWAVLLSLILSQSQLLLSKESSRLLFQQIVLSVGSGIFEEFLFRVILVSGLALLIGIFIKKKYWYKMSIAVFIGAIIFSYFHFVGEFAIEPTFKLFTIRLLAGVLLGYIYVIRGFGIAAYTHSFYNLFVFTQLQANI